MRISGTGVACATTTVLRGAACIALLVACTAVRADEAAASAPDETPQRSMFAPLKPRGFFTQFGVADEVTAGTAGVIWNLEGDPLSQRWGIYVEGSVSRWQSRGGHPSEHGSLLQLALIPVIRYRFDEGRSPWFVEGGIGATVTSSVYRNSDKHFSTAFNFGDNIGVGYAFGPARKDEIALRAEHFSNGGIKHPNPGQNFLELRYVHHFD